MEARFGYTRSVSHLNAAECFVFEAEKMAYSVGSRAPFPPLTLWLFLHVTGKCFMKLHAKRPGKHVQKQMLKKFWLPSRWVKSRRSLT